jgi:beta-glucosidase
VALTNTGPRAGREVVQVYLEPPQDGMDRPVRLLAGFAMVQAEPGARVTAEVHVPARAFRIWDGEASAWRTPPGRYRLHVGRSSRDARLTAEVTVDDGRLHPAV